MKLRDREEIANKHVSRHPLNFTRLLCGHLKSAVESPFRFDVTRCMVNRRILFGLYIIEPMLS